jgi:hypothetical protein
MGPAQRPPSPVSELSQRIKNVKFCTIKYRKMCNGSHLTRLRLVFRTLARRAYFWRYRNWIKFQEIGRRNDVDNATLQVRSEKKSSEAFPCAGNASIGLNSLLNAFWRHLRLKLPLTVFSPPLGQCCRRVAERVLNLSAFNFCSSAFD